MSLGCRWERACGEARISWPVLLTCSCRDSWPELKSTLLAGASGLSPCALSTWLLSLHRLLSADGGGSAGPVAEYLFDVVVGSRSPVLSMQLMVRRQCAAEPPVGLVVAGTARTRSTSADEAQPASTHRNQKHMWSERAWQRQDTAAKLLWLSHPTRTKTTRYGPGGDEVSCSCSCSLHAV